MHERCKTCHYYDIELDHCRITNITNINPNHNPETCTHYQPFVQYYGWYSQEQINAGGGTSFWSTPDGREVEITEAISNPNKRSNFKDAIYVGPVNHAIRIGIKRPDLTKYNNKAEGLDLIEKIKD